MNLTPVLPAEAPWDFTALADTYDFRPDYCRDLIHDLLAGMPLCGGDRVLDVGAGTGKLAAHLCAHGLDVIALEPNPRMRALALVKPALRSVRWIAGRGEALPLADECFDAVTFGSSFNVVRASVALDECARVVRPGGFWLAVYNHRDLDDPLQRSVEAIIRRHIPGFDYGRRRSSPVAELEAHGAFASFAASERSFVVEVAAEEWMLAWHSHATLQRQAGHRLPAILAEIRSLIDSATTLSIPYMTRAWTARRTA